MVPALLLRDPQKLSGKFELTNEQMLPCTTARGAMNAPNAAAMIAFVSPFICCWGGGGPPPPGMPWDCHCCCCCCCALEGGAPFGSIRPGGVRHCCGGIVCLGSALAMIFRRRCRLGCGATADVDGEEAGRCTQCRRLHCAADCDDAASIPKDRT